MQEESIRLFPPEHQKKPTLGAKTRAAFSAIISAQVAVKASSDTSLCPLYACLALFEKAIREHMDDPDTIKHGYDKKKETKVFFNKRTNNVVILDEKGDFLTGFSLVPGTEQFMHYMSKGRL
ncbi:MAG: hypothetical protein LBL69_04630 [Zoogloeaceae bacterium]|jgi:hypothetical protein|nr:hypothetical protein [Zoogloeaceae bacterium]